MWTSCSVRPLVSLGLLGALACSRPAPPAPPASRIETVAWDSPGIAKAPAGSEARYVVRDGPIAASFAGGGGVALHHAASGTGLRWTLDGARAVEPVAQAELPGRIHDLRGDSSSWTADQRTYGRVAYRDVYPGVTLTVETRRHGVAYRFDLAPAADPGAIRMRYTGADDVVIEDGGKELRVRWGRSSVRERGLRCFQEIEGGERDVECRYASASGGDRTVVGLTLGKFDRGKPLIIDPDILWGSYLGGTDTDQARAIAVDDAGNVYVTGWTYSTNFPTPSGFDRTFATGPDAFVTKVSATGTSLTWSTYLGGNSADFGYGIGVDASGSVFVTGYTSSSDFDTTGGFDTTFDGGQDSFVAKFDASGAREWSSFLGGSSSEYAQALAVDSAGEAYITGYTYSPDFPTPGGFDTTLDGGQEVFVARVTSGGAIAWSTFLGGNSSDSGYGIALDTVNDVYVTGYTYSTDFPSSGGFSTTFNGGQDAFVTKITNGPGTATVAWSSFLGGTSWDYGQAVAVDAAGNAYLTGYTQSTDFPSAGGFDTALGSYQDAFVAKVDPSGAALVWSSYLGGDNSGDQGQGIVVDAAGGATLTGSTYSNDFPTVGGFDMGYSNSDAFVTRVDSSGALEWSSYLGGGSSESGYAIALGPNDNVFVTGDTYSMDFPVYLGFDFTNGGSWDVYVARIVICGNNVCELFEDSCNCPTDCGADTCGNGCCGSAEDCQCGDCLDLCGNDCCGPTENTCTCAGDCGADTCGNGCCGPTENPCDCAQDCGNACGDGCCNEGENPCFCPGDCGVDVCGNGCQGPGETACTCPEDTLDLCGDGCCTGPETCETCAECCPEPAPDGGDGDSGSDGCGCRVGTRPETPTLLILAILLAVTRRRRSA